MKTLLFIDTYPSTENKVEELKSCIESLKKTGIDILITSHLPVGVEIQNLCDYYIYDKNNLLLYSQAKNYFGSAYFYSEWYTSYHSPAICLNMFNGFNLAKLHNYEFVVYITSDCILSKDDLKKLVELINFCETNNKIGFVFNPPDWYDFTCDSLLSGPFTWETIIFGFRPEEFLFYFDPPNNLDSYYHLECPDKSLEAIFFHKLQPIKDKIEVISSWCKNFFDTSQIDLSIKERNFVDFIKVQSKPDILLFFLYVGDISYKQTLKIFIDSLLIHQGDYYPNMWYYQEFNLTEQNLKIELLSDNGNLIEKNYILNEVLLNKILEKKDFISFY